MVVNLLQYDINNWPFWVSKMSLQTGHTGFAHLVMVVLHTCQTCIAWYHFHTNVLFVSVNISKGFSTASTCLAILVYLFYI